MTEDRYDIGSATQRIRTEAADWFVQLLGGAPSEFAAARFREWLHASPAHRREFDALDAMWRMAPTAEELTSAARGEPDSLGFKWHLTDAWRRAAFQEPRGWDVAGPAVLNRLAASAPGFLL